MRIPTPEECTNVARVEDVNGEVAYAIWWPQTGGYVGRAIVTFNPGNGCFDAYIWHDGKFPIQPDDENNDPYFFHFCGADGFIEFGQTVKRLQESHGLKEDV